MTMSFECSAVEMALTAEDVALALAEASDSDSNDRPSSLMDVDNEDLADEHSEESMNDDSDEERHEDPSSSGEDSFNEELPTKRTSRKRTKKPEKWKKPKENGAET